MILLSGKDLQIKYDLSAYKIRQFVEDGILPKPYKTRGTRKYWTTGQIERAIRKMEADAAPVEVVTSERKVRPFSAKHAEQIRLYHANRKPEPFARH